MAFTDVHEEVFSFLLKQHEEDDNLVFRVRKTNRGNKLNDGYWFLGNDDYLSIGFWKGMNWKSKIPNISFIIEENNNFYLRIDTNDSKEKQDFVDREIKRKIGIQQEGSLLIKKYNSKNYLEGLSEFLNSDWHIIDLAIREKYFKPKSSSKLPFGTIDIDEFREDLSKIKNYRYDIKNFERKLNEISAERIYGFTIRNYGPIKECSLHKIPKNAQWVFLTGENGVGKSSILKALASTIAHRRVTDIEKVGNKTFETIVFTNDNKASSLQIFRKDNNNTRKRKPYTVGFAAYGPIRLKPIHRGLTKTQFKEAKGKNGNLMSMFDNESYMLDLETQLKEWGRHKNEKFHRTEFAITEFLESILLNVGNVEYSSNRKTEPIILFQEIDENEELHDPITIDKLSSGYLSIMAMMSDMLIRLFQQQPDVYDPGDLKGVVFIDEIDIHLHPKFQKHFVEQLTLAFPNIQFIVTTHSPIPLLGAPQNSVICVVKRSVEKGVIIERLTKLENEFKYLLPNTLLTSDIFDFDILEDVREEDIEEMRFEDEYNEIEKNEEVNKRLESLERSIFPDDLFKDDKQ